jgi:hypothetical protein
MDLRKEAVLAGRRCVVEKLATSMPVDCPTAFHSPLDEKLLLAKQRNLSFYAELEADVKMMTAVRSGARGGTYAPGTEIDFRRNGNASRFQRTGWSEAEPWATWTLGPEATLAILLDPGGEADLELHARVTPFVIPERSTLDVEVLANGNLVDRWKFSLNDGAGTTRTCVIPARIARQQSPMELTFRISDPISPAEFGRVDTRKLGVAFTTLMLAPRKRE